MSLDVSLDGQDLALEAPGFLREAPALTLAELWERCIEQFLARYESAATRSTYARSLGRLVALALESGTAPTAISPSLLHRFRVLLGESTLAPATIAKEVAVISSLLDWLGAFVAVPSAGVIRRVMPRPRVSRRPPRVVSVPELESALEQEGLEPRDRLLVQCLAVLGLRAGEIGELQLDDIVRGLDGQPLLRVHGKGGRVREVPLPAQLHADLVAYIEGSGRQLGQRGPIFLAQDRAHQRRVEPRCQARNRRRGLSRVSVWAIVRRVMGTCSGASPHAMRHTAAVTLLEAGADLEAVRDVLGHSVLSVTGRYLEAAAPWRARGFLERSRLLRSASLPPPPSR